MDNYEVEYEDDPNDTAIPNIQKITRGNNTLPEHVESVYWKEYLHSLTTFHQVQDEIIKKVKYLEPWEHGSRNQSSSCIGVRGVSAGGRVTTAFCLLFKLFTLRLTRKQIVSMINNEQNTYLRAIGFLYIRYCQPPKDLYDWFEPYLYDKDIIMIKSRNGNEVTIGEMIKQLLTNLDFFGTLLPRIPIPIQNIIDKKIGINERGNYGRERSGKHSTLEKISDLKSHSRKHRRGSRSPYDNRKEDRKYRSRSRSNEKNWENYSSKLNKNKDKICSHHRRHHHCLKHQHTCPKKAKKL